MRLFATIFCLLFIFSACVKEDYFGKSAFKQIRYFQMEQQSGVAQIIEDSLVIRVAVSAEAELDQIRPDSVLLSSYAHIEPDISTYRDFQTPQQYTVFAEDGTTSVYTVFVSRESATPQLDNSALDDWYTPANKNYQEPGKDGNTIWATGNPGVVTISTANVLPLELSGNDKGAQLITKDLGSLGQLTGQRMAAGTIFTGTFSLDISNPLNSAKFGVAFSARPVSFTITYGYQPGTPYKNNKGATLNKLDSCDIYLLLENRDQPDALRIGTGWLRSGEAMAYPNEITIPILYGTLPGGTPAYAMPANNLFGNAAGKITHLSFVAASSSSGALFEGGVNSTLTINNLVLNY